jgi:hypothetical protein
VQRNTDYCKPLEDQNGAARAGSLKADFRLGSRCPYWQN